MAATWDKLDAVSVRSTQIATEAAPTLTDDGMPINGVRAITFWLDAGAGQTLTSDAGQVDVYVYDADLWGVAPALVLQVPPGSSGQRRVQLGTVPIDNQRGRLAGIANGLTVSGASLTLDLLVTLDRTGNARAA